jgi:heme oxygenase (biliverdin-producing, ferredoxin)
VREGSRLEHEAAEGSAFVTGLLAGRVDREGYATYLRRLRAVYAAMESVGRAHLADLWVAAVHDPALERLDAIDADLAVWSPGGPADERTPAVTAYVERLAASGAWGGLFVAHHYTRYLGDLSGGQAIGATVRRTFDLTADGAGTAFYAFPSIPRVKPYKDAYRARLDALAADEEQVARVVEEVRVAFRLNRALLDELGRDVAC